MIHKIMHALLIKDQQSALCSCAHHRMHVVAQLVPGCPGPGGGRPVSLRSHSPCRGVLLLLQQSVVSELMLMLTGYVVQLINKRRTENPDARKAGREAALRCVSRPLSCVHKGVCSSVGSF